MVDAPEWLPALMTLAGVGGDWSVYCERVYEIFRRDFIESQPRFRGEWVRCRRDPKYEGKEAGFWHCVQQGADEQQRTPDLRRCERIAWIRVLIEHADTPGVEVWETTRGTDRRHVLWFNEEFVVVLAGRRGGTGRAYKQLVTAYCTDREHTKRKLRKERDASENG